MKSKAIKIFIVGLLALSLLAMPFMSACGPKAPEEGAEPVILGLPTSLGYWFGRGAVEAATLAVEEVNAAGGVNVGGEMRPFKLVTIDTRDSVPGVPTADSLMAVEKLILEEGVHAIVAAPNRSEVLLAELDVISKYKIPQLSTLAKTPAIQTKVLEEYDKYKYEFRVTLSAIDIAKYHIALYKHIGEKFGFNKYFGIHQDVLWARGVDGFCAKTLKEAGWEIVGMEAIPVGATDFSMALTKAKEGGAQVIGVFFDMPEVSHLIDQYATMKIPAVAGGVIGPLSDPGNWEAYEGRVEGVMTNICEVGVYPSPAIPKSVEFFDAYTKRWGHEPEGVACHSPTYDSVYNLKDAIERAGTLDADALVTALEQTDMKGAIGRIRFGKDHQVPYGYDPEEEALSLFIQWQQPGVRKVVFPTAIADAELVLPPWMK